ncbi:MAG: pro-sigmaK processing inhibitor BofA family protein [Erysipelotrichales bacterium]|nr:pro-sigmaK processing inhibitor BofA family protein [Erysipelotrichales bacterium]
MFQLKKYLKRFIVSTLTIYTLDYILIKFGIILPINCFSIIIYTVFGFPGIVLIALLVLKYR